MKNTLYIVSLVSLSLVLSSCFGGKKGGSVKSGGMDATGSVAIVSAREVDVMGDDGNLSSESLTLQDRVYIIRGAGRPPVARAVKISRDPSDTVGIGWVDSRNLRILSTYKRSGATASAGSSGGDGFDDTGFNDAPADAGFDDDFSGDAVSDSGDDFIDDVGGDDFSDDASGGDDFSDDTFSDDAAGSDDDFDSLFE